MGDAPHTTIFYVDDDPDDLIFFQEALDETGKNVSLFNLGDNMLNAMRNPPPNPAMIFLDLNMPGKSGFDILAEIKSSEAFRDVPVIILSTSDDPETIAKSKRLGAQYYIPKSRSMKGLKKSIRHAVGMDWERFEGEFVWREWYGARTASPRDRGCRGMSANRRVFIDVSSTNSTLTLESFSID